MRVSWARYFIIGVVLVSTLCLTMGSVGCSSNSNSTEPIVEDPVPDQPDGPYWPSDNGKHTGDNGGQPEEDGWS